MLNAVFTSYIDQKYYFTLRNNSEFTHLKCVLRLESLLAEVFVPTSYKSPITCSIDDNSSTTRFITARTVRGSRQFNQSLVSTLFRSIYKFTVHCIDDITILSISIPEKCAILANERKNPARLELSLSSQCK